MFSDRSKLIALAIVHVFETSKPFGDYSAVAVLNDGAGISYGINQFTHRSGHLEHVLDRYKRLGGTFPPAIATIWDVIQYPNFHTIAGLSDNARVKQELRDLGHDPLMRQAQNEIAFERFLKPAMDACEGSHFELPLSLAVIYDSINHGSYEKIRDRVTVDRSEHGNGESFEHAWITAYVHERDAWLASVPRLASTRYRTKLFINLIKSGNWDLRLPIRVQGVTLTDAMFSISATAPAVEPTVDLPSSNPPNSPDTSSLLKPAEIVPPPNNSGVPNSSDQKPDKPPPDPQVVFKEKASAWSKAWGMVCTFFAFVWSTVTGWYATDFAKPLINNARDKAASGLTMDLLPQLALLFGVVIGIGVITVLFLWLGVWVWNHEKNRVASLNEKKLDIAANTQLATVELTTKPRETTAAIQAQR